MKKGCERSLRISGMLSVHYEKGHSKIQMAEIWAMDYFVHEYWHLVSCSFLFTMIATYLCHNSIQSAVVSHCWWFFWFYPVFIWFYSHLFIDSCCFWKKFLTFSHIFTNRKDLSFTTRIWVSWLKANYRLSSIISNCLLFVAFVLVLRCLSVDSCDFRNQINLSEKFDKNHTETRD